jgi:(hydroxyamino)benzene mutase
MLLRQGHRLLQIGVGLFLLTSFEGFVIPSFAAPRLGLSAHSLMALLGILLIAMGLLWSKLRVGIAASRFAFWLLIYSSLAIIAAYLLGAFWGAGNSTMPLAAGTAHGSDFQEAVIRIVAYSSAPTGIVSFALILWGLASEMRNREMAKLSCSVSRCDRYDSYGCLRTAIIWRDFQKTLRARRADVRPRLVRFVPQRGVPIPRNRYRLSSGHRPRLARAREVFCQ